MLSHVLQHVGCCNYLTNLKPNHFTVVHLTKSSGFLYSESTSNTSPANLGQKWGC